VAQLEPLQAAAGARPRSIGLPEIRAARERIGAHVRETPVVRPGPLLHPIGSPGRLVFKLESLQVTGSFKARGAASKVLSISQEDLRGLATASGGSHGVGVAYAGWMAGVPATIFLPANAPEAKAEKTRAWGATVIREGEVWDDADRAAQEFARERGLAYVHPFADPAVIAGQGTIALELLAQAPEVTVILAAIGGGGLISGVATAAKALNPRIRLVGIEPTGAPTLYECVRAGRIVELPQVTTAASTLATKTTAEITFEIIRERVDDIVLVSDDEMCAASRWLWFEMGIAAELSGAAAVAALMTGRVKLGKGDVAAPLICGAGTDGVGC
jgi:threonine dehydratase